jgi:RNA recognition motif-containing protein
MNIYISNLPGIVTDKDLSELFSAYGEVQSSEIVLDGFTGLSRGFGFVEMADEESGKRAVEALNNSSFNNRVISVMVAAPKQVHKGSYKVGNGAVEAFRFRKN